MTRLFGTDGVRGIANRDLTGELAFTLGRATVIALASDGDRRPQIVIGRDTRASGEFLEAAFAAGVCSAGGDSLLLEVTTTPAVAFLTNDLGAHAGVVISASHNTAEYNGIKIFGRSGYKLPDDVEEQIEAIAGRPSSRLAEGRSIGRIVRDAGAVERYVEHVVSAAEGTLGGLRVVVDCANGGAFHLAPAALARLALFSDHLGRVVDGDPVLAALAADLHEHGELRGGLVVTTAMANLGFRRRMEEAGITTLETKVGDRYVLEEMLRSGAVLGGEQSGHVIFLRHATTGDGLLTAVQFLTLAARTGVTVADLAAGMTRYPQVLQNVPVADPGAVEGAEAVWRAVRAAEESLGRHGRVLVRPSGTEPVVRVMVEAETQEEAEAQAAAISEAVSEALGPARTGS